MTRLELTPPVSNVSESSLADLPLHPEEEFSPARAAAREIEVTGREAGFGPRVGALAADVATILLLAMAAILGADVFAGELPSTAGLPWAGAFVLLLSFPATVLPLMLFGRTVGMALAGLTVRPRAASRRLTAGEAARRWFGTLLTAATLGAALLFTLGSPRAPTPADRWSGRPLEASVET